MTTTDALAPGTTGTDLARSTVQPIGELARAAYHRDQIDLIKSTVAKGASDAELDLFLELCARYALDPFAGQVYCARMTGNDGEGGQMVTMVGRDGMLVIARRNPDFRGIDGDVVYANDTFKVKRQQNGERKITHEYSAGERGEILGAWAIAEREGMKDTYYFARIEDYKPTHSKVHKTPWGRQTHVMILKCAQSTVLRFAYSITGLVGAEEAAALKAPMVDLTVAAADGEIEWGEDPWVVTRLMDLFAAANEARPDSFRKKKIQAMLAGKTDGERRDIIGQVERYITEHGGVLPEPPADNMVEEPSERIEDADYEVVDESEERG